MQIRGNGELQSLKMTKHQGSNSDFAQLLAFSPILPMVEIFYLER